jgi:hypothetical protein
MDYSFGSTNFLHLRALARQDARNQNGAARMVAEGLASVNQLDRSKFKGHVEHHREIWRSGERAKTESRGDSRITIVRISIFELPARPITRSAVTHHM